MRSEVIGSGLIAGRRLGVDKLRQVIAYSLRPWLPDVQPGADRAHLGHPPGRDLTREHLSSLLPQRIAARSASSITIELA